jgi:death-on-curing protein
LPSEPVWLTTEEVTQLNLLCVGETGEPHALLNASMLDSALANPKNKFHYGEADVLSLGVNLLFSIARNHPFEQGNKRTGFSACVVFLNRNGYRLTAKNDGQVGIWVDQVITRQMTEAQFRKLMAFFVQPRR